jgi:hypothetical protein
MTFFGRGVLLEYHLPVFELRSHSGVEDDDGADFGAVVGGA